MRAGEVIGKPVVDHQGRQVGFCTDLRCAIDQPEADAAPRITLMGLIVSPHRAGSLLGYERGRTRGPWVLRAVVARLHRGMVLIPWEDVAPVSEGPVRLVPGARCQELPSGG